MRSPLRRPPRATSTTKSPTSRRPKAPQRYSASTPPASSSPSAHFTAARTPYWILPENERIAPPAWSSAVDTVTPFLKRLAWSDTPRSVLTIFDLPDPEDAPYETGALLATSIRPASTDQLEGILAHALTHAWMQSPRAWLSEGVAHFMGTLWVEKQHGRDQALGDT